jgi:transcriptional regulator with XRE-family HTH domain
MNVGERIKDFRKRLDLNQRDFAKKLGYSYGYIADLERGRQKPSREFLEKLRHIFGVSGDYILHGNLFNLWTEKLEDLEAKLKSEEIPQPVINKVRGDIMSAMVSLGEDKYQQGYEKGMKICEPVSRYQASPTSTKKLLDEVIEILESGDEVMIEALNANIRALLQAVRTKKIKQMGNKKG